MRRFIILITLLLTLIPQVHAQEDTDTRPECSTRRFEAARDSIPNLWSISGEMFERVSDVDYDDADIIEWYIELQNARRTAEDLQLLVSRCLENTVATNGYGYEAWNTSILGDLLDSVIATISALEDRLFWDLATPDDFEQSDTALEIYRQRVLDASGAADRAESELADAENPTTTPIPKITLDSEDAAAALEAAFKGDFTAASEFICDRELDELRGDEDSEQLIELLKTMEFDVECELVDAGMECTVSVGSTPAQSMIFNVEDGKLCGESK